MTTHDRILVDGAPMVVRSVARDGTFFVAEDSQKRVAVIRSQICQGGLAGRWNLNKHPVKVEVLGNAFIEEVHRLIERFRGSKMPGTVPVKSKCKVCKNIDSFEVPAEGMEQRRKGVPLSKAFPDLPVERLVQLSRHVCPSCQAKGVK